MDDTETAGADIRSIPADAWTKSPDASAAPAPTPTATEAPGPLAEAQLPAGLAEQPVGGMATAEPEVEDRQVTHNEPILTGGAAGDPVERLVKLLAHAGYGTNSIVQGNNHARVLDDSVMADVRRFWNEYPDAREPEELVAGQDANPREIIGNWVGPHTWQKLYDLARGAA